MSSGKAGCSNERLLAGWGFVPARYAARLRGPVFVGMGFNGTKNTARKKRTNGLGELQRREQIMELIAAGPKSNAELCQATRLGISRLSKYLNELANDCLIHAVGIRADYRWAPGHGKKPNELPRESKAALADAAIVRAVKAHPGITAREIGRINQGICGLWLFNQRAQRMVAEGKLRIGRSRAKRCGPRCKGLYM